MDADQLARLQPTDKVYIAGHRGLVGSAIWRQMTLTGFRNLVGRTRAELDLCNTAAVERFFAEEQPKVVVLAAAKVGGILANSTYPADFLGDNLKVQVNVFEAALRHGVERLLFLGSSCIYPKLAAQPITEDALLSGSLEPTNEAYAIAKIAGMLHVQAMRRQHGVDWITCMPTNLYGPNDNFNLHDSHVLPALIRRFHEAVVSGQDDVELWGTGNARREFMHADDMARACIMLLDRYSDDRTINVGVGADVSIRQLAETVADVTGFTGRLVFDTSKPDGTPRKLLNVDRLTALGFAPRVGLDAGIRETYAWYRDALDHGGVRSQPAVGQPAGRVRPSVVRQAGAAQLTTTG